MGINLGTYKIRYVCGFGLRDQTCDRTEERHKSDHWNQVQATTTIPYRLGETYDHISPCLRFHLRFPFKCAVLYPIEYTTVYIVFVLYAECGNEVTPPCVLLLH